MGTARRLASGALLLIAGLAGLLPLALPFGVALPSGWAAIRYFGGEGADLPSALCIGLVAVAGLGLTCLGALLLLPRIGPRVRGRAAVMIAIALASSSLLPAIWFATASEFRLGGMAIGTYSFLLSGLIGSGGVLPALTGRPEPARQLPSSPSGARDRGPAWRTP